MRSGKAKDQYPSSFHLSKENPDAQTKSVGQETFNEGDFLVTGFVLITLGATGILRIHILI